MSRPVQDDGAKQASETDRTDRKAVLEPLRVLIEGIETAVVVVDAQRRILTCSAAFCELFSVTEVEGRYIDEVIGQRLNLEKEYARAIDESAVTKLTNVEISFAARTGWFDIHTRPWLLSSTQTSHAAMPSWNSSPMSRRTICRSRSAWWAAMSTCWVRNLVTS